MEMSFNIYSIKKIVITITILNIFGFCSEKKTYYLNKIMHYFTDFIIFWY